MNRTSRLVGAAVLGLATLASGPVERAFAATTLVTLEAEAMSPAGTIRTDATASGGRAVLLSGNGSTSATVSPPAPATSVTVRAKGDQCLGAPALAVKVGGATVGTFSVSATSWSSYTVNTSLAAGPRTLTLAYTNDRTSSR